MKSKKVHKRFSWLSLSALMMLTTALLSSCFLFYSGGGESTAVPEDVRTDLENSFLITHTLIHGKSSKAFSSTPRMLAAQPLTPFSKLGNAGTSLTTKATINRTGETTGFTSGGPIQNYPEPGQSTSWTVTPMGNNIYKIKVTTTYPTSSPAQETVEEYLVKDYTSSPYNTSTGDGVWNQDDPIVNESGTVDKLYRIQFYTLFRDGSVRYEKILMASWPSETWPSTWPNTKLFKTFNIDGSLDYPPVYEPEEGSGIARYSSVVLYTHVRTKTLSYWFWEGTQAQNTVGIRYYTEQENVNGAAVYSTTLVFEKTLNTYLTLGGSLADSLTDLYVGGSNDALAKTVIRQEVKFDTSNVAFDKKTKSKVTVYDVTGNRALYLTKLNEAEATGNLFTDDSTVSSQVDRTVLINNDPYGVPLITNSPPSGDLGTLYAAIENGALVTTDSKTGATAYQFNGQQGMVFNDTTGSDYDLTTEGTVELWLKIFDRVPWAGLVHKGIRDDFADEVYSLQFWSVGNDIAFVLNPSSGNYLLVQAGNPYKNLALNTWYYIVATWNTQYIDLYVNGQRVGRKNNSFYRADGTPNPGVRVNDAPVVVGAQFATNSPVYRGYFGLKGIIDNWKVHKQYWNATTVQSKYNNPGS